MTIMKQDSLNAGCSFKALTSWFDNEI